jgi:hypothetical protein
MGPGYSSINEFVVLQTSQGLCEYALSTIPADWVLQQQKKKGSTCVA